MAGISYREAVDEALCFGWIDGIKKRVDEARYTHRFTPRKAEQHLEPVNAKRVEGADRAEAHGEARARGVASGAIRRRPAIYSFENRPKTFDAGARARRSRRTRAAWTFFRAQPPGYQRLMMFYVMSAKQPETRGGVWPC